MAFCFSVNFNVPTVGIKDTILSLTVAGLLPQFLWATSLSSLSHSSGRPSYDTSYLSYTFPRYM